MVADFNCQKHFLAANAAIDGPMTIATAIIAAAFAISPDIPKTPIPQFAMPKARALNISAITYTDEANQKFLSNRSNFLFSLHSPMKKKA